MDSKILKGVEPVAWKRTSGTGSPVITEEFLKALPSYREDFRVPLYTAEQLAQVVQQRDELLAALKEIRVLTAVESGAVDAEVFDIAREAIAKVKP